jgi:hypothetical protein
MKITLDIPDDVIAASVAVVRGRLREILLDSCEVDRSKLYEGAIIAFPRERDDTSDER